MAKVIVRGNLGKDAEIKQSQHGEFATATLAEHVNKDTTDWWGLTFNNPRHINLIKKDGLKKGSRIEVIGTFRQREYEYNGEKRFSNDVFVDSCEYVGGGTSGATETTKATQAISEEDSQKMIAAAMSGKEFDAQAKDEGDDLPF